MEAVPFYDEKIHWHPVDGYALMVNSRGCMKRACSLRFVKGNYKRLAEGIELDDNKPKPNRHGDVNLMLDSPLR